MTTFNSLKKLSVNSLSLIIILCVAVSIIFLIGLNRYRQDMQYFCERSKSLYSLYFDSSKLKGRKIKTRSLDELKSTYGAAIDVVEKVDGFKFSRPKDQDTETGYYHEIYDDHSSFRSDEETFWLADLLPDSKWDSWSQAVLDAPKFTNHFECSSLNRSEYSELVNFVYNFGNDIFFPVGEYDWGEGARLTRGSTQLINVDKEFLISLHRSTSRDQDNRLIWEKLEATLRARIGDKVIRYVTYKKSESDSIDGDHLIAVLIGTALLNEEVKYPK